MPFSSSAGPAKKVLRAAHALAREGGWEEAIPLYQQATELAPGEQSCWMALGHALQIIGRFPESAAAYQHAVSLDPEGLRRGRTGPYGGLMYAYVSADNLDAVVATADLMRAQAPDHPDTWRCQGLAHAERREYAEAESAFQHALELAPYHLPTLRDLAQLYISHTHDYERALELIDFVLTKWPLDGVSWHLKGVALLHFRQIDEATNVFQRSLSTSGNTPFDALGNRAYLGLCLLERGKFGEALEALDRGESSPRGRLEAANGRGVIMSRIRRPEQALAWYDAALRVRFTSVIQSNKVETLAKLGRQDEAEAALGELLARDPDSVGSWVARSVVATFRVRYDEALEAFNHSLVISPRNASIHVDFARLLLTLGDIDHARAVAERARALDPCDAAAWEVTAQALRAAGRAEEARAAEDRGAALLAEQTAEVDTWLRAREARGEPATPPPD